MVNVQLVLLVTLCLSALYVFILMIRKLIPEKKHKYTGGVDDQGRYDGVGKLVAVNGDIYTGDFKAGTFHGHGSYVFKKGGGSYTGEFREGLFAGQGKEVYPDGSKYIGGFDNSKRSGHGQMHYANGAIFTGSWKTGKKEGHGIFKYSDGTRFDGRFIDGKRDGVGYIYDKKNRKLQGKWKNGKLLGGKLTRVLHKTSTPDPLTQQEHADATSEAEEEDSLRTITPSKVRQRHASSSSSNTPQHHSGSLASPSHSSRSAQKEKEFANQLLNFSKKQLSMSMLHNTSSLTSDTSSAQDRERSKLIAELARTHSSNSATYRPSGISSTSSSSASSSTQSVAASVSGSPAVTPSRQPPSKGGNGYRGLSIDGDQALEDISSSGLESELGPSGLSESENEQPRGEWQGDDPTHVSNNPSHSATPTVLASRRHLSPMVAASPKASPTNQQQQRSAARRDYLSSGSEKENHNGGGIGGNERRNHQPASSDSDKEELASDHQLNEKSTRISGNNHASASITSIDEQFPPSTDGSKLRANSAHDAAVSTSVTDSHPRPNSSPVKKSRATAVVA